MILDAVGLVPIATVLFGNLRRLEATYMQMEQEFNFSKAFRRN